LSKKYLFLLVFDTLCLGDVKMMMYYKKETLFIELEESFESDEYQEFKERIWRIIDEYGIERVRIEERKKIFSNENYLRNMKQDYYAKYHGDFRIR